MFFGGPFERTAASTAAPATRVPRWGDRPATDAHRWASSAINCEWRSRYETD